MRLSRHFKPVYFFTKRFRAHKKLQNVKQTTFKVLGAKIVASVIVTLFFFCWFIFAYGVFLLAQNFFVKKQTGLKLS